MLFRQRDADTFDAERLRVAGEHADQEPQYAVDLRRAGDRGHQRRLRGTKGAQFALPGRLRKTTAAGWGERDPDGCIAIAGVHQRQGALPPNLPGPDLLSLDPALQGAQEALPTRVLSGVDGNLHP